MTQTIADFDTPLERVTYLADEIGVRVGTFPTEDPDDLVDQALGLLFMIEDTCGHLTECLLVREDAEDEERAAGILFALSIVTVFRDVDRGVWEQLRCRLDDDDEEGNFIAISRDRLAAPKVGGFGRLAAMLGERAGLSEPAHGTRWSSNVGHLTWASPGWSQKPSETNLVRIHPPDGVDAPVAFGGVVRLR